MYMQKTKTKWTQSEESALRIRNPSYPVNKNTWKIDANIPVKYIRILNFNSAPGGLGSGPSHPSNKQKEKERRKEGEKIDSFKIFKRSELLHQTNKQTMSPSPENHKSPKQKPHWKPALSTNHKS